MNAPGRLLSLTVFTVLLCASCSSVKVKHGMNDGRFDYRQTGEDFKKVDVYVDDNDSINVFVESKPVSIDWDKPQYFKKATFDFDALTVPFKFRSGSSRLPRQLDTDFNGNIYIGYRVDRFRISYQNTPVGLRPKMKHVGFSGGIFGGLGSSFISPWTTNDPTFTKEYNGFILSRGMALLVGVNSLTFGVGVGWDYLTDRDKDIWIYQNKPWFGLTVGLNVN
jgi:hypothetical protein